MTVSSDPTPDPSAGAGSLTRISDPSGLMPHVAAKADESAAPRGFRARLLDYSAHAAMIVGLIGFAWTVGDHVVHRPALADKPAKVAASPAPDPLGELRERNRVLGDDVQALQTRLEALQTSVAEHAKLTAQVHGLQAGLDGVKAGLGTARIEQTTAVARLDGKIDKLAHEPGSKIQSLVDRLGKLEHSSVDIAPTASLPHALDPDTKNADARPKPTARSLPRPADPKGDARNDAKNEIKPSDTGTFDTKTGGNAEPAKPPVLASWVVRDVYQGVALIEGRRGTLEVVPGVSIPGAGVVKSIDRHGSGWTVTTTKGLVAFAAPARDNRRAERGAFGYGAPGYGDDF